MILVWIGALLVGLSLGLLGSGGSILTVPLLIYVVGEQQKVAIAESLGIVASISLLGLIPYAIRKKIHWKSTLLFGIPGMAGASVGAWTSYFIPSPIQLMIFAAMMLMAALMMLQDEQKSFHHSGGLPWWLTAAQGLGVGFLTGLVGVGGGFLIVPALVLLGGLSIHLAVGTSLVIIAMQSITGFVTYLDVLDKIGLSVNIHLMLTFGLIGAAGSFAGRFISSRISGRELQKGFAGFLLLMGSYILYMNW